MTILTPDEVRNIQRRLSAAETTKPEPATLCLTPPMMEGTYPAFLRMRNDSDVETRIVAERVLSTHRAIKTTGPRYNIVPVPLTERVSHYLVAELAIAQAAGRLEDPQSPMARLGATVAHKLHLTH